jgi:hypothetical protein
MTSPTEEYRKGAAAGEPRAVEEALKIVMRWLLERGAPLGVAENVVRELYLSMRKGRYRPSRSMRAYALGIRKKMELQRAPARAPRGTAELHRHERALWDAAPDPRSVDPLEWLIKSESQERRAKLKEKLSIRDVAQKALDRLSPEDAEMIRLLHLGSEPMDRKEVARRLGMTAERLSRRYDEVMRHCLARVGEEVLFAASGRGPLSALVDALDGNERLLVSELLDGMAVKEISLRHKNRLPLGRSRAILAAGLRRMRANANDEQAWMIDDLLGSVEGGRGTRQAEPRRP